MVMEGDRQSRRQAQAADRDAEESMRTPEPPRLPEIQSGVEADVVARAPQWRLRYAKTIRATQQPYGSHRRGSGTWKEVLTSGLISLLTGPHQISFSELGSRTIRLSEGERPVFAPE
jgi:hypothetical protein